MISVHCRKCYAKFFTFSEQQYQRKNTEYVICKNEAENLRILADNLIRCALCSEIVGQTANNNMLVITKIKIYTYFGNE